MGTGEARVATVSAELRARRILVAAGFSLLGAGLLWSRFAGLNLSLWHDEIYTVQHYVRPGPHQIFFGHYVPNNHMLFSLLAWLTSSAFGGSEVVYRLWSVVPFVAGVVLVTRWLQRLEGTLTAALYLFLATASPLLIDWSRQARGYGLAFFAMSVMTTAACDALRAEAWLPVLALCAAGVIGTWDLPIFGAAFASVSVVLLFQRSVRWRLLPWLGVSVSLVVLWYLPVLGEVATASQQQFGDRLPWHGVVTGPIAELLRPSLVPNGGVAHGNLAAYLFFGPLLAVGIWAFGQRSRPVAAVLLAGVVGTYAMLALGRMYVESRFVSYLLVPLLILVAVGVARLVAALRTSRPPIRLVGATALALGFMWLGAVFVTSALLATTYPFEAFKEAAAAIDEFSPTGTVVVNVLHPDDLRFYLKRPIVTASPQHLQQLVCRRTTNELVYVEQPFRTPHVNLGCLERAGATHKRVRQYTRGDRIDVWFLPARSPS
jgi:hypothetical protein